MSNRSILGIAGAAMIGTLAMTNVAHARFEVNATGEVTGKRAYIRETLTSTVAGRGDSAGTFYVVNSNDADGGSTLDVRVPVGFTAAAGEVLRFRYDFTNLVLAEAVNLDNQNLRFNILDQSDSNNRITVDNDGAIASGAMSVRVLEGGNAGDGHVEFVVELGTGTTLAADDATLFEMRRLGVHLTEQGSIRVTMVHVVSGLPAREVTNLDNVVKVASAFSMRGVAAESNPVSAVREDFQKFSGTVSETVAYLGNASITIAATSSQDTLYTAAVESNQVVMPEDVGKVLRSADITVAGNVSFLQDDDEDLYLATAPDCSPTGKVSLLDDNGALRSVTWDWSATGDANITGNSHLCMVVDGESDIPATEPYRVTIAPFGIANAAFPPPASRSDDLARVTRDGGVWRIAYLTTNQKYNQRVIIQNRSSKAVDYSMTFQPGEDVTATAGDGASGMLAANSRMVLNARDVVTIEGAGHVSATLEVGALATDIEVATVTTVAQGFESAGSTDTVLYEAEPQ